MNCLQFFKMNLLPLPKYYELILAITFLLGQANNTIQVNIDNSHNTDLEPLGNITNYYDYRSYATRRYRRQTNFNGETCKIPNNPPRTTYVILSESEINYKPGDYVKKLTALEIKCDEGYKLSPLASSISNCINGEWNQPLTNCIRACPSLMSSATTIVKCKYNGIPLANCINPVKGTTVLVSCSEFYEEATLDINPLHVCRENAWVPPIPECYPTCGMKTPKGNTNIVMGRNATPGDYPWHVGIYTSRKEFQCGGSIIDSHIIVSAAHCFTDYNGVLKPTENYLVAAGKYYREYDDNRDKTAQYSTILEIHVPERYKGLKSFHAFDIAILILKDPFELSIGVQPVCIELNEGSQFLHFSLNSQGIVMGWGYTQEGSALSDVLKELTIPYIPFDQCYQEITESFRKYVTFDKICAGFINNATSVCGGDSGGGFVFKNFKNDRYYVKAIVSASPASTIADVVQCDTNQYSVYTSIEKHIEFVRNHITFNRREQPVICKQNDCKNEQIKNVVNCQLPNNPLHGKYFLPNQNDTYTPGNNVSQFVILFLTCDAGYEASPWGATQFICLDKEQWTPALGICTEVQIQVQMGNLEGGDKSKQKCEEYGKYVFENGVVPPDSGSLLNTNNCPISEVESTVNLKPAKQKEFPHMALIGFDGTNKTEWHYGGSLISEKFVLTAAHCVSHTYFGTAKYILLGELIIDSIEDGDLTTQQILIKSTILHPSYAPPVKYSNIALFELEHNAILNAFVRPACLNTNQIPINMFGILSGWGQTALNSDISTHMQKATINIFSNLECNHTYRRINNRILPNGIVEETQVCAGARNKSEVDVCQGGDPLQIVNSEVFCTYKIIGVSAFGRGCGVANNPAVYTRVSAYIKWIEDIVWP